MDTYKSVVLDIESQIMGLSEEMCEQNIEEISVLETIHNDLMLSAPADSGLVTSATCGLPSLWADPEWSTPF